MSRLAAWSGWRSHPSRPTSQTLVRLAADALLINLAFFAALILRYLYSVTWEGNPESDEYARAWSYLTAYVKNTGPLTLICLLTFSLSGFYSHGRAYRGRYKVWLVTQSVSLSYLFFGSLGYVARGSLDFPRSVLVLAWALSTGLLVAVRLRHRLLRYFLRLDRHRLVAHPLPDVHNILVIGGAGYIGSALLPKLLNQGYRVRLLDRLLYGAEPILELLNHPRLEVRKADFRQVDKVVAAMQDIDAVVHLGAIVGDPACALDEDLTIEVNLSATRMIAEVARGCGVRHFIFASTCSVYGASEEVLHESSPLNPVSLYARTKIACEQILMKMAGRGLAPTILRFGTIYGLSGRTRFDLVVNLLAAKAQTERLITVFGGNQWRPFIHVDDAAQAIFSVLIAPTPLVAGQVFNVGSDEQNYTIGQVGELIQQLVPTSRLVQMALDGDRRNYQVSFQKIRDVLGFQPRWTIEQGVRQVLEAMAKGEVEDYRDPQYSNVKFLEKEGPARFVRSEHTWARELIKQVSLGSANGNDHAPEPIPGLEAIPIMRLDGAAATGSRCRVPAQLAESRGAPGNGESPSVPRNGERQGVPSNGQGET